MKRKVFEVIVNGEKVATKYAFNAARRYIATAIRNLAEVGDVFELESEDQRFDGSYRIGTVMKWVNQNGRAIIAEVRLT